MAAPTWMTASTITEPDPWVHLSTNTAPGGGAAALTFTTTDGVDVNNWEYYQHLAVVLTFTSTDTSGDEAHLRYHIGDDTYGNHPNAYDPGHAYPDGTVQNGSQHYWHYYQGNFNGWGSGSNGNSSPSGSDPASRFAWGSAGFAPTEAPTNYWAGVVHYFFDINSANAQMSMSYGGFFQSGEKGPHLGCDMMGNENTYRFSATNTDGVRHDRTFHRPVTKIQYSMNKSNSPYAALTFAEHSSAALYGLHWKMT